MTDSLGNGKIRDGSLVDTKEELMEGGESFPTENIIEALPQRTDQFQIDMKVVESALATEYKVTISSGYNRYYASADLSPIQERQAGMDLVISQIETAARQAFLKYMYEEVLPDE
jgi:hypothetical protein